ncbi:hypothetical protein OIDMADRAFT_147096 [Oidiodendron maius Zn]|uniref:Mid2 domain-containing protein n=1 Tax=Oidiodendron maius (strain Zn) TaxID=913774 RepID=A0A0C3GRJ6_OIDMZ|nr:hypothetical protein OIDMADRAFT_147096 [Oidiodendron maius Zn]
MKVFSPWGQTVGLVILTLNVTRVAAEPTATDLESHSIISSIEGAFDDFKNAVESDIAKALVGNDGVLAQFGIELATTPPISTKPVTSGIQSDITIALYCNSCHNATQPTAFNFASQNYSGWNNSWLGFALNSFDALFEIEIELNADNDSNLTLPLYTYSASDYGVDVDVEFQLYVEAAASASMSFTTGLNLSLHEPAAIMMPALDPIVMLNESQKIGFEKGNFVLTPIFNASMPQLDFNIMFSLRTVFSVTAEDINIGALYLDLPAFSLTVNTMTNATSNCQAPLADTPPDEIYAELIHLDGEFVAKLSYELFGEDDKGVIKNWTIWDTLDKCYAFLPGLGSIGDVPPSSKSPLLTAPPITTCTTAGGTNTTTGTAAVGAALKSLSPGAKASVVIGTLAGAVLIASVAWYGGRASVKHSIKNGETGSIWTIPRPRPGKFFSRHSPGWTTKFSPLTPSTPAWKTTEYEAGVFQSPGMESNQQSSPQGWQMENKEPFVAVNEAAMPAPTYISMSDDSSIPAPGARERETMSSDTGLRSAKYEGITSGQVEGLGLLQDGGRPLAWRKPIPRKSVPGHGNGSGSS